MPINPLNHHYAMENPASIYDEEAMTALELAGRTTGKVNECVAQVNKNTEALPGMVADDVEKHIKNGAFDKQIDKYAGEVEAQINKAESRLDARIDNLATLEEGSTTGDAELIDSRVSDLGYTHTNSGSNIRTNLKAIRERLTPTVIKDMGIYENLKYIYSTGVLRDTEKDVVGIYPPIKFDKPMTVRVPKGYFLSMCDWGDDSTGTNRVDYYNWTEAQEFVLRSGAYYSFAIHCNNKKLSLDDGYAIEFVEPFYTHEIIGHSLDDILPLMERGGYVKSYETCFNPFNYTAFYTKGGFTLSEPTVIHCEGESSVAYLTFSNNTITPETLASDTGWRKELTIPANTFGVLYFRKSDSRPIVYMDDLKLIKGGHSINYAVDEGNINRKYVTPERRGIIHRGYSNYSKFAPENTLPAFRLAKKMGYDYFECDVRISKDGIPVICHDSTVDRTSNGSGYVAEMTLEDLKALDFSAECTIEGYAGTQLPTLEETLATAKNLGINIYLEVEPECEGYENSIVSLVKRYGMENAVTYISFSWDVLSNVAKLDASAPLGLLTNSPTETTVKATLTLRTGYNDVALLAGNMAGDNTLPADLVSQCKAKDVPLEVWVVNTTKKMEALDPYIRGALSDQLNYRRVMYDMEMEGF